jgi:hypothetical protein
VPYTQTPQCEGVYKNRVLFDKTATPSDPSYISGQVESKGTRSIVLNAGKAQDIWLGAQVGIYVSNFESTPTRPNPQLGVLRVSKVSGSHSTLSSSPSFDVPTLFYARLLQHHPNETISIFSAGRQQLEAALSQFLKLRDSDLAAEGVSFVDTKDLADVVVIIDGDQLVFERKDKIAFKDVGHQRLSYTASLTSPDELYLIIRAAARFNYHVQRKNTSSSSLHSVLEFHEVHRTFSGNFRDVIMEPGPNLLKDNQVVIDIKGVGDEDGLDEDGLMGDKLYGLTIINPTEFALYPYLFAFDGVDLCIRQRFNSLLKKKKKGAHKPFLRRMPSHSRWCGGNESSCGPAGAPSISLSRWLRRQRHVPALLLFGRRGRRRHLFQAICHQQAH